MPRRDTFGFTAALLLAAAAALLIPGPASAQDYYWENPRFLSDPSARYPAALEVPGGIAVLWQESRSVGPGAGEAYLSLALLQDGKPEVLNRRFAGPYPYRGDEPVLFSSASSPSGDLAVAVLTGDREATVLVSRDGGLSFPVSAVVSSDQTISAPRVFPRAGGGWYLFAARGREDSLTIYYARTEDGRVWTDFQPFVNGGDNLPLSFLPSAASVPGADVVVFQALSGDPRPTYQIYAKRTVDGGLTWSRASLVTNFGDQGGSAGAETFQNQRPHVAYIGGKLYMAWERTPRGGSPQAHFAELDDSGSYVPGTAERVSVGSGTVGQPRLVDAGGKPGLIWFDNRRGRNHVYLAFREGILWRDRDVSGAAQGEATFGRSVYRQGRLWVFWQSQPPSGAPRIAALEPDTTIRPPVAAAADFTAGRRIRRDSASIRWTTPEDSSGIAGFSYAWSRDPGAEPPRELMALTTVNRASFTADQDGSWWFSIRAVDYAGNWSAPARVEFVRDTTPPGPPALRPPQAGPDGFLSSNTFNVLWDPPADPDVAGYTWILRSLGPLDRPPARKRPAGTAAVPTAESAAGDSGTDAAAAAPQTVGTARASPYPFDPATEYERELAARAGDVVPPPASRGLGTSAGFPNVDDGYYIFSVAAIDEVGNIGPPVRTMLRADKFVPFTLVSDILTARDDFGVVTLRILGRGFREDGVVSRIVLDRDGAEPYDYVFNLSAGAYSVDSDRSLGGLVAQDVEAGDYRVGLLHPVRGWYWARSPLTFDAQGTVKFGDFSSRYEPVWTFRPRARYRISFWDLFAVLAAAFGAVGILATLRRAAAVVRDGALVRLEITALLEGGPLPMARTKMEVRKLRTRGLSLGIKFTLVIGLLVLFVTAMVSVPLGVFQVQNQGRNLARGLQQKAQVLLESLAQGARTYLPAENVLELGFLPQQVQALAEARYVTITGYGTREDRDRSTNPDVVWATNDPDANSKLDGPELRPGRSVLSDPISPRIPEIAAAVDKRASEEVGAIAETLAKLQEEARTLAVRLTPENEAKLSQIAATTRDLERTLNERLQVISREIMGSEPAYDALALAPNVTEYIFYKPVVYRQGQDGIYYRGMVRLAVSTDLINQELRSATVNLVRITGSIALLVLAVGVGGAALLAWYIVSPIRKLVAAIERIRDTEDKEQLKGERIEVRTRDELYELASAVNTLTEGLVKAAAASKDLTVGKETQKMFLPLHRNERGEKLSTGSEETPDVSFFGYYEGAKGVSGDFFNFMALDDRYYAFIKCDAAGKGIPAAIISVEVATLFLNHFTGWTRDKGIKLDELCYQINDMVEGRGFKGKFAALTMGVLDGKTGVLHLCHAGDKTQRIYEARNRKIAVHDLPDTPPCGSFPNFLVQARSPYTQTTLRLEKGDVLLLYTDGIEEAKWYQRGPDFKILEKTVALKDGAEQVQKLEDPFGNERAEAIVEAVLSKGRYRLEKAGNPVPDQVTTFDYSTCEGTLEEVVLALISAEKIFRMYPDPQATEKDLVLVDAKIDDFLEKHFDQYRILLKDKRRDNPDKDHPEYRVYAGIREDDQYDDLTLMAIRRK
ncbi:MAG: SpoIIE family protein phosphatase [Treponema sp.]|nr:SpoIIE family protein phosphatase [Treponema sp.]